MKTYDEYEKTATSGSAHPLGSTGGGGVGVRIGSLFSGAGMLDVAALRLFPRSAMAWHSEINPAARAVLAHHWPNVSNLGDITEIDWTSVDSVDVLTGGFPCTDVSAAGHRAGLVDGTRSGLWSHMATAVEILHPDWVLIENVQGLLHANAVRYVESEPDAVGNGRAGPVLRALGAVLGDLADLGYDAAWLCLRASDIGLCHHRARVFILAHPADTASARPQGASEPADTDQAATGGQRHLAGRGSQTVNLLPTPSVADGTGGHLTRSGDRRDELLLGGLARAAVNGDLLPTPRSTDGAKGGPNQRGSAGDLMLPSAVVQWGDYETAIRQQEARTRPAPAPTEPNKKGDQRLSPAFSEWMMSWPDGWVTDPSLGLSRIEQLTIIGNGVVPIQAVTAFRHLRTMREVAV